MVIKPEDTQKFISVFNSDIGRRDGILIDILDNDNVVVLFPNQFKDDGARCSTCIYPSNDVVAIGPDADIEFPIF